MRGRATGHLGALKARAMSCPTSAAYLADARRTRPTSGTATGDGLSDRGVPTTFSILIEARNHSLKTPMPGPLGDRVSGMNT